MKKIITYLLAIVILCFPLYSMAQIGPSPIYSFSSLSKWYRQTSSSGQEEYLMNEVKYSGASGSGSAHIRYGLADEVRVRVRGRNPEPDFQNAFVYHLKHSQDMAPVKSLPSEYRGYIYAIVINNEVVAITRKENDFTICRGFSKWYDLSGDVLANARCLIPIDKLSERLPGAVPGNDFFGSYLKALGSALDSNNFSIVEGSDWMDEVHKYKKECADKLIKPIMSGENETAKKEFFDLFSAINEKSKAVLALKGDLPFPNLSLDNMDEIVSKGDDLSLYHRFFMSKNIYEGNWEEAYSDAYIYSTGTRAYQSFLTEFQISENGITWFWGEERGDNFERTIGGMAVGYILTGGVGAAAAGVTGVTVSASMNAANKKQWKRMAKLLYTLDYIKKHVEFDQCIAAKSDSEDFKEIVRKEEERLESIAGLVDVQLGDFLEKQRQSTDFFGNILETLKSWLQDILNVFLEWLFKLVDEAMLISGGGK